MTSNLALTSNITSQGGVLALPPPRMISKYCMMVVIMFLFSESDSLHADVREGRISRPEDTEMDGGDRDDTTASPSNGNSTTGLTPGDYPTKCIIY